MNEVGKVTVYEYAAWTISVLGIVFAIHFHLVPTLIAGLLVFQLVVSIYPIFARRLPTQRAKEIALFLVVLVAIAIVTAVIVGLIAFLKSEGGSLPRLLAKMAEILSHVRTQLPPWLAGYMPANTEEIGERISDWLRANASALQRIGTETGRTLAHVLIGIVIGSLVALREALGKEIAGPLTKALADRIHRFGQAFRRIVFAQVRISALNTVFTAIYLMIVLPLAGVHLPLTKTMVVVTFLAGMLPIIGNIISNTVVVVVSLAHSALIAAYSLVFLIVIHKLEYFLNARIVGSMIRAKSWELLTAMLIMESAFGLAGLVIAPICYAWLKDELKDRGVI
jgi:predicted PurR-regulated permease PerM